METCKTFLRNTSENLSDNDDCKQENLSIIGLYAPQDDFYDEPQTIVARKVKKKIQPILMRDFKVVIKKK